MSTGTKAPSERGELRWAGASRLTSFAKASAIYARHREVAALLVALLLFCYFLARSGSAFVLRGNMATLAQYVAPVALIAVGESMLLICGEIDLSAGNVYALAPFVTMYLAGDRVPVVLATVIAVALSGVIGLVNGLITVYLRVPSFVTTLGMLNLINGVTLVVTNGATGTPAGGRLYDRIMGGGNWSEFIWAVGVVVVWAYLLGWTRFGTYTFAVGSNQVAAREAGINIARVKTWNFVLMGAIAGLTGILDGVRVAALDPTSGGTGLMFDGVAAAVIGGTALVGGSGSVVGALFGAFFLEILYDGFTLEGVSAFDFDIIIGVAILVAMVLNIQFQELRARHSAEELLGTVRT